MLILLKTLQRVRGKRTYIGVRAYSSKIYVYNLKVRKMKEFLFKVSTYHYIAAENIDEAYDKLKSEIIDEWDQVEDVETLDEHELYDLM